MIQINSEDMANVYFIVADTTLINSDPQQMTFFCKPAMNDISGYLLQVAKRNKTDINKMRLYVCPNKKVWENMRTAAIINTTYDEIPSGMLD